MNWKPIPICPTFEASDTGLIRNTKTGNILAGCNASTGYRQFEARIEGKRKAVLVHRCVWAAFNGRWPDRDEHVHHIDEDKQNNNLGNLELLTEVEHGQVTRNDPVTFTCEICAKEVTRHRIRGEDPKYCSPKCNSTAHRRRHGIGTAPRRFTCPVCGKKGETTRKRKVYCSRSCKIKDPFNSGRPKYLKQKYGAEKLYTIADHYFEDCGVPVPSQSEFEVDETFRDYVNRKQREIRLVSSP